MYIYKADLFVSFIGWTWHYDMEPQDLCVTAVVGKGGPLNQKASEVVLPILLWE